MIDPAGIPRFRTADWKFRIIDGRYRVANVLARSENTAVLVVEDRDESPRVLKVVRHDGDDARFLQIIREFDILRAIDHPGVVRAHRVFEVDENHAALVLGRAPGRNLQTILRDRHSLDLEVALETTRQAARALTAVHEAGWLHRDVKPANIVVDVTSPRPHMTLVDFGIAGPLTHFSPQWFSGTPAYASPEQMRGEPLDERSDMYSLGATLFFALTGRPPYLFDDLIERFRGPGMPPPESLTEVTGVPFPVALERFVARLLSHNPADRPADFDEFLRALGRVESSRISFDRVRPAPEAHDAPTVAISTTDTTVQEIPLQALMEVYVETVLEEHLSGAGDEGLAVWGSASARRRRPFTVDGRGVIYAADQRCVVSTDRAGRPRGLYRGGRDGADISALARCEDAVWTGTTDGHLVVVGEDDRWESRQPDGAAIAEIATDSLGSLALVRTDEGSVYLCRDHGKRWWGQVARGTECVAVSMEGSRFAWATPSGIEMSRMCENSWEPLEAFSTPATVGSMAFLQDGRLAVCDVDGAVWIYGDRAHLAPEAHFVIPLDKGTSLIAQAKKLFACSCDDSGHIIARDVTPNEASGWVDFS